MPMNMNGSQSNVFQELRRMWLEGLLPLNGYTPSSLFEPLKLPSQEKLTGARLFGDRKSIIDTMPKNAKVCEVGTQEGIFAEYILDSTIPSELHLIDIDLKPLQVRQSNKLSGHQVKLHEGDSSTILNSFPDEYFDWIYIDGDHSYEGVLKDSLSAVNKIPEGGYLVFNDFTIWSPVECIDYGVPYVVCEIINNYRFVVTHLALHPLGYHDIAIQKTSRN